MSKKQLREDICNLLYDCCYGKGKVELGYPSNFESSKINVTAFEDNIGKVLRKYKGIKKVKENSNE